MDKNAKGIVNDTDISYNYYVTQFVREKENKGKKQSKIDKKMQKEMLCEERALRKEAEDICQEILKIVKANSTSKKVESKSKVEGPVGILKNRNKESVNGPNKMLRQKPSKPQNDEVHPVYLPATEQYCIRNNGKHY